MDLCHHGALDVHSPDGSGGYVHPYQVFNTLTKLGDNHFQLRFPDDTVYVYNIPAGTTSLQPFLVEIRDVHGQSLTFGYDTDVRLTTITDALGRATTLTYSPRGLVTKVTDPFGRSAVFAYDTARNLTKITDMGGTWSKLTYDADIYLASLENARGKWQFTVEPADGILSHGYPAPGERMWRSYRVTMINPPGDSEEYFYWSWVGYSWYVSLEDYVAYESASRNNLASAPKTSYRFVKIANTGEIKSITYPGGGSVSYAYDTLGNRTKITHTHPPSHTTTFTHNTMGRVTSVTDPKQVITEFTYAANDVDLTQVTNSLGSVMMTYNAFHDLQSVTSRLGHTTQLSYNAYGQIESVIDPLQRGTNYYYNSQHQLEYIKRDGKILASFTYDPVGRVRTRTDATGLTLTYDYDNLDRITRITYPDGKYETYTYAGCCPRLLESATDRSGRTTRYTYDKLERLTKITDPSGGVTTASYDANGNLVWLLDPKDNPTWFAYDLNNRLVQKMDANEKSVSLVTTAPIF